MTEMTVRDVIGVLEMQKTIINLTGSLVIEEIDTFLESYPSDPNCQYILSNPQLRRKLTTFVLSRIPNRYTVLEDDLGRPIYPDFQCASLEKRLKIEEMIRQGIEALSETAS